MRKIKRRPLHFITDAFRRSRSAVERLEDRILLSAEPLVQFNRVDSEQPLVVENLAHKVDDRRAEPLDVETLSSIATLIDLTRTQSQQSSKLNWTGSTSSLLKLNSQLQALVLDLGDGDSQMSLSNDASGMLRLSRMDGASPYDIVFAKPSGILGIRGEGGIDRLVIDNVDLGSTSLSVDAEIIDIPSTSTLTGQNNVLLMARDSYAGNLGQLTIGTDDLKLSAGIDVAGTVQVLGNVVLAAQVSVELEQDVTLTGYYEVNGSTTARVRVADGARITAQSLAISATTESRWSLAANDGLIGGRLALDLDQTTEALVEGGVDISVTPEADDEGNPGLGLLIEAVDWTDASVVLDMADGEITGLSK
ncbi:MAG: LEPR-XLL domain-containing protein, partial [Burkholderiaceae bacterium]